MHHGKLKCKTAPCYSTTLARWVTPAAALQAPYLDGASARRKIIGVCRHPPKGLHRFSLTFTVCNVCMDHIVWHAHSCSAWGTVVCCVYVRTTLDHASSGRQNADGASTWLRSFCSQTHCAFLETSNPAYMREPRMHRWYSDSTTTRTCLKRNTGREK